MSVLDKFLNAMKMNDDDDLDGDDYLDDGYQDYEEDDARPRKRILKKKRDEEDERTPDTEKPEPEGDEGEDERRQSEKPKVRPARVNSKISPMRTSSRRNSGMEVCVIRPKSMEDACEITQTLLDECTVILNMEGIDYELAQRVIDFAGGSCYAVHGNLQKISNYIFIITPQSVDISGDFQEILNGALDVPAFGTRF